MQKVRIAHIATVASTHRYVLLNQLKHIQENGYEVVSISSPNDEDVNFIRNSGIQFIPLTLTRNFTPLHDIVAFLKLYIILRRERFTIVHTHNPKPGLIGQLAAKLAGIPIIINTVHGFYFHENMSRCWFNFYVMMEKIAALCSDIILSQNSEDVETAIQKRICGKHKIKFLGNGINLAVFSPERVDDKAVKQKRSELNLPEGMAVIGFVGRLVKEKGILELLQAAKYVYEKINNIRFLIIGSIDHSKSDAIHPDIAKEYGVDEICRFTGFRHDLPELYSLMNVFVLPSHREGFPRSLMEASAMGIPVIATNIRGCRECVTDGLNGILVKVGDSKQLADAIIDLLSNKKKASNMGRAGRSIAIENFDERKVFNKVTYEYSRLLSVKLNPKA